MRDCLPSLAALCLGIVGLWLATALAAANTARRRYPGVVGQLLANEIDFYLQCGYRTDQASLIPRLIRELTA